MQACGSMIAGLRFVTPHSILESPLMEEKRSISTTPKKKKKNTDTPQDTDFSHA